MVKASCECEILAHVRTIKDLENGGDGCIQHSNGRICVQMRDLGRDIFGLVVDKDFVGFTIEEESIFKKS